MANSPDIRTADGDTARRLQDRQFRRFLARYSRIFAVSLQADPYARTESCGWHCCELPSEFVWHYTRWREKRPVRICKSICRFHAYWVAVKYQIEIPGGHCGGMASG